MGLSYNRFAMTCEQCNALITEDTTFCPKCGAVQGGEVAWDLVADKSLIAIWLVRLVYNGLVLGSVLTATQSNWANTGLRIAFAALAYYNSTRIMRAASESVRYRMMQYVGVMVLVAALSVVIIWMPQLGMVYTALLTVAYIALALWRDRILFDKWVAGPVGITVVVTTLINRIAADVMREQR